MPLSDGNLLARALVSLHGRLNRGHTLRHLGAVRQLGASDELRPREMMLTEEGPRLSNILNTFSSLREAMSNVRVGDAGSAQAAARRYLSSQFGSNNIKEVSFSRAWYTPGSQKDIWEVEGNVVVKKGWFGKESVHFKFQIDPATGRVIAYEV